MISKIVKFSLLVVISLFMILPFLLFKGESGTVFGTLFDQSIFPPDIEISTVDKLIVPLFGTLSIALLILLVIFYLYEAFLEQKTFGLIVIMNIMLIISMIIFGVFLYGYVDLNNIISTDTPLTVGDVEITSLVFNVALAGTMLSLVFVLFVYSNVLWFPIVAEKLQHKSKFRSFKPKKQFSKSKTPIDLIPDEEVESDDDEINMLQPGLERNEIQQRKASASHGRVSIDEFEEVYGLQLKTQLLTDRNLRQFDEPKYETNPPKVEKADLEIPQAPQRDVEQIFSDYERKLKDENDDEINYVQSRPIISPQKEIEIENKFKDGEYFMPRNRVVSQNNDNDNLFFSTSNKRVKNDTSEQEDMLRDSERIKQLLESKNKKHITEDLIPPIKRVQKPKEIIQPKYDETGTVNLTQVEDPLGKPNQTNVGKPKVVDNKIREQNSKNNDEEKSKSTSTIDWELD